MAAEATPFAAPHLDCSSMSNTPNLYDAAN
jgi:hypothetical protein